MPILARRWRLILALLGAAVALAFAWQEWRTRTDWTYVEQTILGTGVVSRWRDAVDVTVGDSAAADLPVIREAVAAINALLAETGFQLRGPFPDPHAEGPLRGLVVVSMAPNEFAAVRALAGRADQDVAGFTGFRMDGAAIDAAAIRLRSDIEGEEREHTIWHEFTHALGLFGHVPSNRVSVLSEYSRLYIKLAKIDRKALRFMYCHLEAGDGPEHVRRAFDEHWRTIPDDWK